MSRTQERNERAQKFRENYNSDNDIEVIPSNRDIGQEHSHEQRTELVGPYCRVSTKQESQTESYELQKIYYEEYVAKHPNWNFVDIYADEGISATSMRNRKDFIRLIEDCRKGIVTRIVTKSVPRFARNVVDCISTVRMLRNLPRPVGVYFETENIDTLSRESDLQLSMLSAFAESESINKSTSIKWAIRQRFAAGIPKIVDIYGFDREGLTLTANEEQAAVVKRIYTLFSQGERVSTIAAMLNAERILSPRGKEKWSQSTIRYILTNERYCGDVHMQKTVCVDVFTHRSVKNAGLERQYRMKDYHQGIVEKSLWDEVQVVFSKDISAFFDEDQEYEFEQLPGVKFYAISLTNGRSYRDEL